jgi:hypothetical protein
MGLSFVILFPLGAIIIRFLAPYLRRPARLHYLNQLFTLSLVFTALGLGIYLSQGDQFNHFRMHTHPIYPLIQTNTLEL